MGLSIHYRGSFNELASLSEMMEEVKDIAEIYKWKYTIFDDAFPVKEFGKQTNKQRIFGISFMPPECEPVWLTFLSNGRMSNPSLLEFFGKNDHQEEQKYLYMVSTKTQYAGIEIHKLIIHLLKYISSKYLKDFTLSDEGNYWETGDEKLLQDIFTRYTDLIAGVRNSFENYPINPEESFEDYFARLIKAIQDKFKK